MIKKKLKIVTINWFKSKESEKDIKKQSERYLNRRLKKIGFEPRICKSYVYL